MPKTFSSLIIVGVGLLGSSVGLAAKKRNLAESVIGIGNCRQTLDIALQRGAVDQISTTLDCLTEITDGLALICTPVGAIVELAEKIAAVNSNILISDVGSTKGNICCELEKRLLKYDACFIGAHPIAGSEKTGPEFGNADLFQDRLTVLTPMSTSCPRDIERLQVFWESLGARTLLLEPNRHDEILARTSHLPHAVAAALASLLRASDHPFCGAGFADTTRIALGSPAVWTDIFLENQHRLLAVLDEFGSRLEELKSAIRTADAVAVSRFLESAQEHVPKPYGFSLGNSLPQTQG
ncbi:MAG: prephenate dehydrogenase/arogenate dehydrogenase family protein [Planctomycetaceae bacterium]|nr:prephenate dehydrogenase/arogenate dehydrogenase family protein [Planctomycetaceae bacterium]